MAELVTRPPDSFWRDVPCGHPQNPVAWVHPAQGYAVCHCGSSLNIDDALSDGVEEGAPGPIVSCGKCGCYPAIPIWNDPNKRVEAATTPEGAKGWADQAGSAQVLAGGHGLNVAPDASPEGVRAETRRENDGAGGEPSNAPVADLIDRAREEWQALFLMSYHGTPWGSMCADLTEDDVQQIRGLIRELAAALAMETGASL